MKRSTDRIRRLGEIQSIGRGRGHRDEEAVAAHMKRQARSHSHVALSPWCPVILSESEGSRFFVAFGSSSMKALSSRLFTK
jgi:hypothetical protein